MATKDHRPTSIPTLLPLLLLLLPLLRTAGAQTSQPNNGNFTTASINSSTAIVIVVLVSAFFFLAFFAVYIRQCSLGGSSTAGPARIFATGGGRSRRGGQRGLDPEVLETFPTFVYSQVKGLKIGQGALECAVCLSEFSDDEILRLLPRCSHVFHPDCIDVWLASHVTCPVCRTDLTAPDTGGPAEEQAPREVEDPLPGHVTIAVGGEEAPADMGVEAIDLARFASGKREVTRTGPAQFRRSHTTGHSVARPGERSDRYTLRLPEHVRREIFSDGRLRRTASCVVFPGGGEASARRGYRSGGEGSRAGRSVRLGARSDRWAQSFLARALSVRVPAWAVGRRGDGEGSMKKGEVMEGPSRGIFPSVRAPFDCLGGGGGGGRSADDDESSTAPLARV